MVDALNRSGICRFRFRTTRRRCSCPLDEGHQPGGFWLSLPVAVSGDRT